MPRLAGTVDIKRLANRASVGRSLLVPAASSFQGRCIERVSRVGDVRGREGQKKVIALAS